MNDSIAIEDFRGLLVIEMKMEKLDFFLISEKSAQLRSLLEERRYPSIIFDFTSVRLIDSSVFGFLLEIRNTIKKKGNEITIVCSEPEVLYVMKMLKVPQIIHVFHSREEAADYLNSLNNV